MVDLLDRASALARSNSFCKMARLQYESQRFKEKFSNKIMFAQVWDTIEKRERLSFGGSKPASPQAMRNNLNWKRLAVSLKHDDA